MTIERGFKIVKNSMTYFINSSTVRKSMLLQLKHFPSKAMEGEKEFLNENKTITTKFPFSDLPPPTGKKRKKKITSVNRGLCLFFLSNLGGLNLEKSL